MTNLDDELKALARSTAPPASCDDKVVSQYGIPAFLSQHVSLDNFPRREHPVQDIFFRLLCLTLEVRDWVDRNKFPFVYSEDNNVATKYLHYLIGRAFEYVGNRVLREEVSERDPIILDLHRLVEERKSIMVGFCIVVKFLYSMLLC